MNVKDCVRQIPLSKTGRVRSWICWNKKLTKLMLLCAAGLIVCVGTFFWGISTIRYKVFPFQLIQGAKHDAIGGGWSPLYRSRKSVFELCAFRSDVVMLGDSITDWGGDFMNAEYPNLRIRNMGISGDTTDGILNRMDSALKSCPKKAFIMVGLNDLNRRKSVDAVFDSYKQIVSKLRKEGIQVYVQSTLYPSDYGLRNLKPSITDMNRRLQAYCLESHSTYIDLNSTLCPNQELDQRYTVDGTHLTGEGYAQWARLLRPHIID